MKAVEAPKASAAAAPAAPAAAAADPAALASAAAAAPETYPGDNASKEQIAAWMAGLAEKRGLPPELPLMASLVESGMKNLNFGDADSVGFFQMRVGIWNQGEYAGYPDKPELQMEWFLDTAEQVKKQRIAAGKPIDDPSSFGEWIADVERPAEQFRGRYQLRLDEARGLLKSRPAEAPALAAAAQPAPVADAAAAASPGGGGSSSLGAAALSIAQSQKGVREVGTNTGPKVDEYLQAAGVAPGNPWCASFIAWSLEKAGHKMPGGGWAAVATWVRNAEQGNNGLKVVSADEARPGDIVAYDWGGQSDFGADGHIGFLESTVKDGKFTALEGNNADKVNVLQRQMGGANIKFIRIEGNAPAGAAPVEAAPAAPAAAPAPSTPVDPSDFGAEGSGGEPSAEAAALLKNKNVVLDDVGVKDIKDGRIDPRIIAVLTKLSSGAQDHRLLHVLGPLQVHLRRLGLQPPPRPRPRHRRDRRRDRRPRQPARPRGRQRALDIRRRLPAERDRLAVRDRRPRLLHRRRPPEPPPRRLQTGDPVRLEAARRRGRGRCGGGPCGRARRAGRVGGRGHARRAGGGARRAAEAGLTGVHARGQCRGRRGGAQEVRQRIAGVHEGGRAAAGRRRRRDPRRRSRRRRRRRRPPPPTPRPPRPRPRPTPTPATAPRRSRSPPGWPGRRRSAGCRRSCR